MSMFEIFAIIQNWYEGNHELASACLAANTHMTLHEAHAYLDEYGHEGMTVLFSRIAQDNVESYQDILDNMFLLRDYLSDVIRDLENLIDERAPMEEANG